MAHPMDVALSHAAPLSVSLFGGTSPLEVGCKDFVAAADGVYVRASTPALAITTRVADGALPYAPITSGICPVLGAIPLQLLRDFTAIAQRDPDNECAAAIVVHNGLYCLRHLDADDRSSSHVTYDDSQVDDDALVVDLHSHGRLPAYFSPTDDASDLSRRGPYLAMVLGEVGTRDAYACRLVLPPYLIDLDLEELVLDGVFA